MTTETILTDDDLKDQKINLGVIAPDEFFNKVGRAIEQAVLQSPEVQALREDAERWRYTQKEGYFLVGPRSVEGVYGDFAVGVLQYEYDANSPHSTPPYRRQLPINDCIEGRGRTLEQAIDAARKVNATDLGDKGIRDVLRE